MSEVPAIARVPSPCRRLCTLDPHDVCMGCGRTIGEICGWSAMDDTVRRQVLEQAERRVAPYRARYPQAYR
jgi:predicted Fe-S protein YdhL (DUF1289 family)